VPCGHRFTSSAMSACRAVMPPSHHPPSTARSPAGSALRHVRAGRWSIARPGPPRGRWSGQSGTSGPGPGREPGSDWTLGRLAWRWYPMIEVTAEPLATHPFLHDMSRDHLTVLAEAAADVTFPARHRLFEDGGSASRFWLIRSGCVALDLQVPGQGRMKIGSIGIGEGLGWSWLYPPYRSAL